LRVGGHFGFGGDGEGDRREVEEEKIFQSEGGGVLRIITTSQSRLPLEGCQIKQPQAFGDKRGLCDAPLNLRWAP
jgi:hypothetical protein